MRQTLKAVAMHFAQGDLEAMIPPDTMDRIRRSDTSPVFKAYVVAEEGDANGVIVGSGRKVIQYIREMVHKVYGALSYGTAAFYRHEGNRGDGDNSNRTPIGELVGRTMREIRGQLQAVAAFYLYPGGHRYKDLKAASIEADIEYYHADEAVRVRNVQAVTGVALSDVDEPAFPGATLLAAMQAFDEDPEKDMSDPANNELIPRDEEPSDNPLIPKSEPLLTMKDLGDSIDVDSEERQRRARSQNPLIP